LKLTLGRGCSRKPSLRVRLGFFELRVFEAIQKTLPCASATTVLDKLSFTPLENLLEAVSKIALIVYLNIGGAVFAMIFSSSDEPSVANTTQQKLLA